jgi:hypothetical protein
VTQEEWLAKIEEQALDLAGTLRDASDAGVSHALVLPRLVLVFRQSFGEPPAGFLAGVPGVPA